MGRNYDREESSATTKLTYLIIGGGIGAILALLFAPKSGEELRGDIADATRKGIEKGKEAAAQLSEKAGEYYEVGRERAGELYQTATEKAGELSDRARSAACTAGWIGSGSRLPSTPTTTNGSAAPMTSPITEPITASMTICTR